MEGGGLVRDYSGIIANIQQYIDDKSLFQSFDKDQVREILKSAKLNSKSFISLLNLGREKFKTSKLFQYIQPASTTVNNLDDVISILQNVQSCLKLQFPTGLIEYLQTVKTDLEQKQQQLQQLQQLQQQPLYAAPPESTEGDSTPSPSPSDNITIQKLRQDLKNTLEEHETLMLLHQTLLKEHNKLIEDAKNLQETYKHVTNVLQIYHSEDFNEIYNTLKAGADFDGKYIMAVATLLGITYKKDPNDCQRNVLLKACFNGHFSFVKALVESGMNTQDIDTQDENALFRAVRTDNVELVKYLIANGFDINFKSPRDSNTAIHISCYANCTNVLKYLISIGMPLNVKNKYDKTPLVCAATYSNIDSIRIILASGKDLGDSGFSVYIAATQSNFETFKLVSDAFPDWRNRIWYRYGCPLHEAIVKGNLQIVEYMIKSGQYDLKKKDVIGKKPMFYAKENRNRNGANGEKIYKLLNDATSFFKKLIK